jgi:hypothetical protein
MHLLCIVTRNEKSNEELSEMLGRRFAGFERILNGDRAFRRDDNKVRFEYARFSDFSAMHRCLTTRFIDFCGKTLSLERGFFSPFSFFTLSLRTQDKRTTEILMENISSLEEVQKIILKFIREKKEIFILNVQFIEKCNKCFISFSSREDTDMFSTFCKENNKQVIFMGLYVFLLFLRYVYFPETRIPQKAARCM